MDRKKKVGFTLIRDPGPLLQTHITVVGACIYHFAAHTLLDESAKTFHDVERQIFLEITRGAMRTDVVPAVACIEYQMSGSLRMSE